MMTQKDWNEISEISNRIRAMMIARERAGLEPYPGYYEAQRQKKMTERAEMQGKLLVGFSNFIENPIVKNHVLPVIWDYQSAKYPILNKFPRPF